MKWISVKERLPGKQMISTFVINMNDHYDYNIHYAYWWNASKSFYLQQGDYGGRKKPAIVVTHWCEISYPEKENK